MECCNSVTSPRGLTPTLSSARVCHFKGYNFAHSSTYFLFQSCNSPELQLGRLSTWREALMLLIMVSHFVTLIIVSHLVRTP